MTTIELPPTTTTPSTTTPSTSTVSTGTSTPSVAGAAARPAPRRLTVQEYRRALHWAWYQDPEGLRVHDEPVPTPTESIAPAPAGTAAAGASAGAGAVSAVWSAQQTITVTGLHGGAGASTIAVALAETAAERAGVVLVDPAVAAVSGLTCAATTELGVQDGWRLGTRGGAQIERRDGPDLPAARPHPGDLIVLDAGVQALGTWEHPARTQGYRVLVSSSTPGALLRLDTALGADREAVAVLNRCPKVTRRWKAGLPPLVETALEQGRLVCVPHDRHLDGALLGADRLPKHLHQVMATVLDTLP